MNPDSTSGSPPGPGERLAVAAVAAGFLYLVLFRGSVPLFPFTAGTNGVFLDEGLRILRGELPYRDFFEFVAPGNAFLNAGIMALLGPRVAVLTAAFVLQGALLAALLHAQAARLARPPWRLLPPLAFVVLAYAPYTLGDHKWPALGFVLAGLLVLGGGPLGRGRALGGGLLLGTSPLFTQDLGAGACAGALLHFAGAHSRSRMASLVLGCGLPGLVALGVLATQADLATILHDSLLFPAIRYPEFNRFYVSAGLSLRTLPREAAQLVLSGAGLLAALPLLRRDAEPRARLVAFVGLGVLLATLHRGLYPAALAVQTSLLAPLWARWLQQGRPEGSLGWVRRAALAIAALGLVHGSLGFVVWRRWLQPLVREEHRAGSVWVPQPLPELTWVEGHAAPGEPVFLLPARCGQYFLSGMRSATSFPYLIEGQSTPEQARRALAEIEARAPRIGVWDTRPAGAAPPVGPVLEPLLQGLLRLYDAQPLPSGVLLLSRKPGRASFLFRAGAVGSARVTGLPSRPPEWTP